MITISYKRLCFFMLREVAPFIGFGADSCVIPVALLYAFTLEMLSSKVCLPSLHSALAKCVTFAVLPNSFFS